MSEDRSALDALRRSTRRELDELALLVGEAGVVPALAMAIAPDCILIAEWRAQGMEPAAWPVASLEVRSDEARAAAVRLATRLAHDGFDWASAWDHLDVVAATLREDLDGVAALARVATASAVEVADALRVVFMGGDEVAAEALRAVHRAAFEQAMKGDAATAGEVLVVPAARAGVGLDGLRAALREATGPTFAHVQTAARVVVVEQLARAIDAPRLGYRYEAGASSLARGIASEPEGPAPIDGVVDAIAAGSGAVAWTLAGFDREAAAAALRARIGVA